MLGGQWFLPVKPFGSFLGLGSQASFLLLWFPSSPKRTENLSQIPLPRDAPKFQCPSEISRPQVPRMSPESKRTPRPDTGKGPPQMGLSGLDVWTETQELVCQKTWHRMVDRPDPPQGSGHPPSVHWTGTSLQFRGRMLMTTAPTTEKFRQSHLLSL